jgi:DNA-binding NarL/FixJ family response regulator
VNNPPANQKSVLIVDDSTAVRQRLVAILNQIAGVQVVGEATDADEALKLCQDLRPDVMTLDLVLPGESGVDVLEQVQQLDFPPQVIVLTNYPYPAFRKRCMELGAGFFLNKATEFDRIEGILSGVVAEEPAGPEA